MNTYAECIPCFLSQASRVVKMTETDPVRIKRVLDEVALLVSDIPLTRTPPHTATIIYRKIAQMTGVEDPFKEIKRQCTEAALRFYPELKRRIATAEDPLLAALQAAVAGNIIDFGVKNHFNLDDDLETMLNQPFALCHYEELQQELAAAKRILYIGDNAGETVFDRLLIEALGKPVTYVVRERPIINDATIEDAKAAGLHNIAELISSGCPAPGTILPLCSEAFLRRYQEADLIISKGQGNYEGLSEEDQNIFFLLKVKCTVIARHIGISEGAIILKKQRMG